MVKAIIFTKYLIFLMLLVSCGKHEREVKEYGMPKAKNDLLNVSLKFSEFKDYGMLIDRIKEITCNDSIPKIVVENKYLTRNIFPIEYCEPMIFDPKGKHYVSFEKGKAYKDGFSEEIQTNSLSRILENDFTHYLTSNESEKPEYYMVIIESIRNEKLIGIEKFLSALTLEFDKLETTLELNIGFWEVVPYISPPALKNDKQIDKK